MRVDRKERILKRKNNISGKLTGEISFIYRDEGEELNEDTLVFFYLKKTSFSAINSLVDEIKGLITTNDTTVSYTTI